jgi:hypothetical protein
MHEWWYAAFHATFPTHDGPRRGAKDEAARDVRSPNDDVVDLTRRSRSDGQDARTTVGSGRSSR